MAKRVSKDVSSAVSSTVNGVTGKITDIMYSINLVTDRRREIEKQLVKDKEDMLMAFDEAAQHKIDNLNKMNAKLDKRSKKLETMKIKNELVKDKKTARMHLDQIAQIRSDFLNQEYVKLNALLAEAEVDIKKFKILMHCSKELREFERLKGRDLDKEEAVFYLNNESKSNGSSKDK